jgi:hypothetical protein
MNLLTSLLILFAVSVQAAEIKLSSPIDYQIEQRISQNRGKIRFVGTLLGSDIRELSLVARIEQEGKLGDWRVILAEMRDASFNASLEAPAGGWYRVDVRIMRGDEMVAETSVAHVGVGDIFVVAGQSNSANHGAEKQQPKSGLVATFDGKRWQLSHDPQPGASGGGGSFIPPLGDLLSQRFHVPVGFLCCGIGATSVREWLPQGATFPNPPTLTKNVQQTSDGQWQSKGQPFADLVGKMKILGPQGFRAVLWHQGESDANQKDASRTLEGKLYQEYLGKVIRDSSKELGWAPPWFVAQVSYHIPGDEASEDIRSAQAALWKDGTALEGPDSDALKGDLRENNGQGVHFSGPGLREHAARWADKVGPWLAQRLAKDQL